VPKETPPEISYGEFPAGNARDAVKPKVFLKLILTELQENFFHNNPPPTNHKVQYYAGCDPFTGLSYFNYVRKPAQFSST
jgi:hypothetical protein